MERKNEAPVGGGRVGLSKTSRLQAKGLCSYRTENAICYKMSWERLPTEIARIEGNKTSNRV